ncbi:MAG TPA: polysaccharide deacetylase [Acidobacteriota bacterium]|nr:polysaccharide deacetylase [Acidobacteriota bacterium]HNG92343.1 polysaccharide deacetylase [Acidobacteriota bacterium]HNH82007.1 polysaccharide deacetylase [Acidobacteriota bacterium]
MILRSISLLILILLVMAAAGCQQETPLHEAETRPIPAHAALFPENNQLIEGTTQIAEYRVVRLKCWYAQDDVLAPLIAIRSFHCGRQEYLLTVDFNTLHTQIIKAEYLRTEPCAFGDFAKTSFGQLLSTATTPPFPLQNDGLQALSKVSRYPVLTVDLCPTPKSFERELFEKLIACPLPHPIPVTVCISGLWIKHHPAELQWLKQMVYERKLDITWANHSFHHHVQEHAPLQSNFLLMPHTDLNQEILELEKSLIEHGITPSVFFRFPGLVSDQHLVEMLCEYSLVPIGSNAWLAKGQSAQPGSLLLVHGNGNEPLGVRKFLALLNSSSLSGLESLPEAASQEFKTDGLAQNYSGESTPSTIAHRP